MLQAFAQYEDKFRQPRVIVEPMFRGKLPDQAFELEGPVIDLGKFTWEAINTDRLPIAFPLSGRAGTICLLQTGSPMVFAASILPDQHPALFASSAKVVAALRGFISERTEARVLVSEQADPVVNRIMARIVSDLKIPLGRFDVLRAEHSPALHPIIENGNFYTVEARVITSMSEHQDVFPTPTWAPIKMR